MDSGGKYKVQFKINNIGLYKDASQEVDRILDELGGVTLKMEFDQDKVTLILRINDRNCIVEAMNLFYSKEGYLFPGLKDRVRQAP